MVFCSNLPILIFFQIIILLPGGEYPAVVEYAPYQAVPKKKVKKDLKMGTILEGV